MGNTDDQQKALADFIARHAKPYDSATDDYECDAFASDIKEGKNDPIYNAHSYASEGQAGQEGFDLRFGRQSFELWVFEKGAVAPEPVGVGFFGVD
jgi:hypothetical protein